MPRTTEASVKRRMRRLLRHRPVRGLLEQKGSQEIKGKPEMSAKRGQPKRERGGVGKKKDREQNWTLFPVLGAVVG